MSRRPAFAPIGFAHHPESTEDYLLATAQIFRTTRAHWVPVPNREAGRLQVCSIA